MVRCLGFLLVAFSLLAVGSWAQPLSADPGPSAGYAVDNGDVNGDLRRNIADPLYLVDFLFNGGTEPVLLALCGTSPTAVQNGDSNGDGRLNIADVVHFVGWIFLGTSEPARACGSGEGSGGMRNANPRVIPVNASPHGQTYGEWSATWWQWAFSLSATHHPLADNADCSEGQTGKVWFLGGSFGASATAERDCSVPPGTAIYFPIINSECSSLEDPPFFCNDSESCRACNEPTFTEDDVLEVTIDGVELTNLQNYLVSSDVFDIAPLPPEPIFGLTEGDSGVSGSAGYYLMLAPLSKGEHRLDFRGCFGAFGGCPGFELVIGYDITVE